MKMAVGALALAWTVVTGQRVEAADEGLDIALHAPPEIHAVRLRLEGTAAADYACTGPCVLHVSPGRYQLDVTDDRGESNGRRLDLVSSESVDVAPPRHRLATTGAVLAVTGLVVAGVSGAIFSYGVIKNFDAWGCDSNCETVSRRTLVTSATVFSAGVALGVVGAVLALTASRPTVTERPESAQAPTGTSLSWVVLPGRDGRSAQAAVTGRF